ncbi:hypothetical protein F5Y19DRAFT_472765 [Xylariaceae sp. FL1651]|nr:hypothetical protein F5Y19DRAFT_472765 [Xylariaceae sp. FL1651]
MILPASSMLLEKLSTSHPIVCSYSAQCQLWPLQSCSLLKAFIRAGPTSPILYRIRVPVHGTGDFYRGQVIRYLTAPNLSKGASGVLDNRGKLLAFDTISAGDWGRLAIAGDSVESKFILAYGDGAARVSCLVDAFYDHRKSRQANDDSQDDIEREVTDIQCINRLNVPVLPVSAGFTAVMLGPDVIGVGAWQPGLVYGIEVESYVYSIIQARDPGPAPRFLAHITDNGTRALGFLLERSADAREAGTRRPGEHFIANMNEGAAIPVSEEKLRRGLLAVSATMLRSRASSSTVLARFRISSASRVGTTPKTLSSAGKFDKRRSMRETCQWMSRVWMPKTVCTDGFARCSR